MLKQIFIDAGIFLAVYTLYINLEALIINGVLQFDFDASMFPFFILLAIINLYYQKALRSRDDKYSSQNT